MSTTTQTYMKLDDMLEQQAVRLDIDLRGGYTEGYESLLGRELISKLSDEEQEQALDILVGEEIGCIVAANDLLDECNDASYETEADLARILLAAIVSQGNQPTALRELVTSAICDRQKHLMVLRQLA